MVAKQNYTALFLACALALALLPGSAAAADIDTRPVPAGPRASALPEGWQHGAFMEIFVRAWRDSNGDGIGDLRGLTLTLDHLQDLGVRGIWLMPITANADGDHGYATTDFRAIAPEYGTLADFDELIHEAHKRGIGVVMDYVINHSAAAHPMFQQALKGRDNPFRRGSSGPSRCRRAGTSGARTPGTQPRRNPGLHRRRQTDAARAAGRQQLLLRHLRAADARLQFPPLGRAAVPPGQPALLAQPRARRLPPRRRAATCWKATPVRWNDQPESRALTKQLQDLIKGYQHRYVVCEATAEPTAYGDPAVCGGAFAFGFVQHYVGAALGKAESVQQVATHYETASPTMATFLSNHDIFAGRRLWDQVGGDVRAYKLAAAGYLLQPGTPFIYYGEEIGQAGVPGLHGDLPLRAPYSWTADAATAGFTTGAPFRPLAPNVATHNLQAQRADPASIFNFYKAMLKLRNGLPSLLRGTQQHGFAQGLVAGWQRVHEGERTLVLINYGSQLAQAQMHKLPPNARLLSAYPEGGAQAARANAAGEARLWLGPQAVRVLIVDTGARKAARKGGKAQVQKGKATKAKQTRQKARAPAQKAKPAKAAQPRKKPASP